MVAIGNLLNPTANYHSSRAPLQATPVFVHLAQPKRRALIKAIGYDEVPERALRAAYGPSWGAVQRDLRALLQDDIIVSTGLGSAAVFSLNLSAFGPGVLDNLLGQQRYAVAA